MIEMPTGKKCGCIHTHTCNETVLPGDGGQVVAVDIALKLKDFSRLKKQKVRERESDGRDRVSKLW